MFAKIELDGGPALDLGDAPRREEAFQIGGALLGLFYAGEADHGPRAPAQPSFQHCRPLAGGNTPCVCTLKTLKRGF